MIQPEHLVLASASPRRKELLQSLGYVFEVQTSQLEEVFTPGTDPHTLAQNLAVQKALDVQQRVATNALVLAADTIVWHQGKPLGKPADSEEAAAMLKGLSGSTHSVITGIALAGPHGLLSDACTTQVSFLTLAETDIQTYLERGQPLDKAGAYGIQEWIGLACISSIHGSYFNVVGLPTHLVHRHIQAILQG
jgi:septum formation protein